MLLLLSTVLLWTAACQDTAKRITNVSEPDKYGYQTCAYDGLTRKFILYVPETAKEDAPLVFMLHARRQNAFSFQTGSGMNETAQKYGYAVVYPEAAKDILNKSLNLGASWSSGFEETGVDDVGFLCALANYLQKEYGFRKDATFAVGYINGGYMAYCLANNAQDTFRAVASISSNMTKGDWDARKETAAVGILQVNGTKDRMIYLEDAQGLAPAVYDVVDYWKNANGLDVMEEKTLSDITSMRCYSGTNSAEHVWYLEIEGATHTWPSEEFSGIIINNVMLDFFDQYARNG
ncbi:MAG: PHB depolymerase family esterase [Eubacteriales bacterium]|nr:PHB depolymerase family esterase [Eubacteriales bacterium]